MFPKKKLNEFELEYAHENKVEEDILANENLCYEAIARLKLIEKVKKLEKDDSSFHSYAIDWCVKKFNDINYEEENKIVR